MMFRFLVAVIVIYLIVRLMRIIRLSYKHSRQIHSGGVDTDRSGGHRTAGAGEDLVEDPQCKTYVPITSAFEWNENGHKIYFCSRACLEKYIAGRS
jgi:YHS domain-containing protein